jgi:probable H4MPT-linked C1 transfer pathway protein
MTGNVLGLDIGGANLKAACVEPANAVARSRPFALWRDPAGLADALSSLLRDLPEADAVAATMTGELCDCFATKSQGVLHILTAVEAVAAGRPVRVWGTDGAFHDPPDVRESPLTAAASNWLALATWAGRLAPRGGAVLLDVGSTTTDIIPLRDGAPVARGPTDRARLASGELVYTGARRTPLCSLVHEGVAAELFASTLDAYLILGEVPEDADDADTADGRPATRPHAHARLARMICEDAEGLSEADARRLAGEFRRVQRDLILRSFAEVAGRCHPDVVLTAGSGEHVAGAVARMWQREHPCEVRSLGEALGPALSTAACAYAAAVLGGERR